MGAGGGGWGRLSYPLRQLSSAQSQPHSPDTKGHWLLTPRHWVSPGLAQATVTGPARKLQLTLRKGPGEGLREGSREWGSRIVPSVSSEQAPDRLEQGETARARRRQQPHRAGPCISILVLLLLSSPQEAGRPWSLGSAWLCGVRTERKGNTVQGHRTPLFPHPQGCTNWCFSIPLGRKPQLPHPHRATCRCLHGAPSALI